MEKTLKWNAFPYEEPSWRLNISAPISVMQAFWQQCLESLKRLTQNTPKIYTTWFEVLKPTYWNEKDGILTLEAPATKITYIRGAYQKSISAVATRIHGSAVAVSLVPAQVKPVQREESGTSHPPSETEINGEKKRDCCQDSRLKTTSTVTPISWLLRLPNMLPRPLEHSTTRSTFTEALVLVKPT